MSKKSILIIITLVILLGIDFYFIYQIKIKPSAVDAINQESAIDPENATYFIDGQKVHLTDGLLEEQITPDSASRIITRYFGNTAEGDFNNDGINDVALILTQNQGGSGLFYYITIALGNNNGYQGINAIFLGDRISPQKTEFRNGEIIVNYADRLPEEPMTAIPSIGISKYFKVDSDTLVEI